MPGCLIAFWWQVHRAFDGNGLSYLYSVEWPVFALAGVWGWWQLVHIDPGSVGQQAQARLAARLAPAPAPPSATAVPGAVPGAGRAAHVQVPSRPAQPPDDEDPELAAYNEWLAELATQERRGWRRR